MPTTDPRRRVPRTDAVLADPLLADLQSTVGRDRVREAVREGQEQVRRGDLPPELLVTSVADELRRRSRHTEVLNATGVVLHTNLGRAQLAPAAVEALVASAGCTDVELDLATGVRARRGRRTLDALARAVPAAGGALVVNNGAAALSLVLTSLAQGREVLVSRGEVVEIGDGFRLPDLIESTGVRLREVGTTNRTRLADYTDAVTERTAAILKVHPSNFRVEGFTSEATVAELAGLSRERELPLVVDIGSGLLRPDPVLPGEPDAATTLAAGATLVTCSGDKLLGGPQAGIVLGAADVVERVRRHPLQRALRADKLTLAALAATLGSATNPTHEAVHASSDLLRDRAEGLGRRLGAAVVPSVGRVGGGSAPGLDLPGWAIALPEPYAERLRLGSPAVVARVEGGRTLLDVRCLPPARLDDVVEAVLAVRGQLAEPEGASGA